VEKGKYAREKMHALTLTTRRCVNVSVNIRLGSTLKEIELPQ
jgi:hypothetical protein